MDISFRGLLFSKSYIDRISNMVCGQNVKVCRGSMYMVLQSELEHYLIILCATCGVGYNKVLNWEYFLK